MTLSNISRFSSMLARAAKLVMLCVCVFMSQSTTAQTFEEGVHYTVIENNGATKHRENEVVEYFSFSCPGCNALEPTMEFLVHKSNDIKLRKVHVPFGGPRAKFSQKVFVLMDLLNAQTHKNAIFNRIHVKRNLFDSDDEIITYFVKLGYESKLVRNHLSSFSADNLIRKMNAEAMKLKIRAVPTVVINNKYKLENKALSSNRDFLQLVAYLYNLDK